MFTFYNNIINSNAFSLFSSQISEQNSLVIQRSFTFQTLEVLSEILILSLFPYPFWDSFLFETYWTEDGLLPLSRFFSDYLFLCMLLRSILFYRCINLYSIYADAFCQKLCNQVGAEFDITFV